MPITAAAFAAERASPAGSEWPIRVCACALAGRCSWRRRFSPGSFRMASLTSGGGGGGGGAGASLRKWIAQRLPSFELSLPDGAGHQHQQKSRLPQGVLTPASLPQFTIPRRVPAGAAAPAPSSPSTSPTTGYELAATVNGEPKTHARSYSGGGGDGNSRCRGVRKLMRSLTVDGTCSGSGSGGGGGGESQLPDTNADPGSVAAVSLPHLRTQTSFGFTTVSELPNTKRKESLFLGSQSLGVRATSRRIESANRGWKSLRSTEEKPVPRLRQGESRLSLFSKSSGETPHHFSPRTSPQSRRRKYRLQKSASDHEIDLKGSSDSLESGSAGFDRFGAAASLSGLPGDSFEPAGAATAATVAAEMQLLLCYDKTYKSLRVRVLRAENLGRPPSQQQQQPPQCTQPTTSSAPPSAPAAVAGDDPPSTFLKLCLMPGKRQRRQSQLVRCTSSPVYDEEFFFSNVVLDNPGGDTLRVRVHGKGGGGGLRKGEPIGEVLLPLDALGLHLGEELCVWRDLTAVKNACAEPSLLNCMLRFEPRQERLVVTVVDVRNIPKASIMGGLPDPLVKVTLSQPQRPVAQKHTRIRLGTTNPVFNEAFEFPISPRIDDMAYTTVMFVVCRREKLRGDVVVGAAALGYSRETLFRSFHESGGGSATAMAAASSSSECYQWNRALQHPYVDVDACHVLRSLQSFDS